MVVSIVVSSSRLVIPMFTILDSTITRRVIALLESMLLGHNLGAQILQEMVVVVSIVGGQCHLAGLC